MDCNFEGMASSALGSAADKHSSKILYDEREHSIFCLHPGVEHRTFRNLQLELRRSTYNRPVSALGSSVVGVCRVADLCQGVALLA